MRGTLDALGADRALVSLQVTNEANMGGAPNASDGYYQGAEDALIEGVIAAKQEIRSRGFNQIKVGFNWAYDTAPGERNFWSYLRARGGVRFLAALDWVGLDVYPGTWGPRASGDLATQTRTLVLDSLRRLRADYLPLAAIPDRVPLHISENGYPTGPGRTDAMQLNAMTAAIDTVDAARRQYNISDYRWFDLRDADSSNSSFESQYGLLRDDYSPKAAFTVYRDLVARLSVPRAYAARHPVRHRVRRHRRRHRRA